MRPDRVVVGEVRGPEALDMLQAMNTGHDGSMTTLHSNGPRDTLARLETMVMMAGIELPHRAIREQIASAVDVIVHQERLFDGSRKVTNIAEVQGMEGDVIILQDIFRFEQTGLVRGKVQGSLKGHGRPPEVRARSWPGTASSCRTACSPRGSRIASGTPSASPRPIEEGTDR